MELTLKNERISEEEYKRNLYSDVQECYEIARIARKKGMDILEDVEIPLANDMADRIEELIGIRGISKEIRELSQTMSREEVSIEMAKRIASRLRDQGVEKALDGAVRTGLAILTEGILVAPLEGISSVKIGKNYDGTDYVTIVYAGPIRGAGGTAQALSVLIGDIVRRELGIGSYKPTEDEIERYIEEVQAYNRVKHLQYLPDDAELKNAIKNCPVCIDGEGSEDEEVSGHRDMERIKTNRIRGGMCLVLCEGLLQKSKKVLKHTEKLGISEWSFLNESGKEKGGEVDRKAKKFLQDVLAGRPVFSMQGAPGGFRLRYGRSRLSGLAAASIHPASMVILDSFIATGSQIKVELPGKAAAVTPCDEIEGPMILTKDGRHIRINSQEEAEKYSENIEKITDLGEILISYGDFLENNHVLEKSPFSKEWYDLIFEKECKGCIYPESPEDAFQISREKGIPLHPKYNYFWHDLTVEEIDIIGEQIFKSLSLKKFPEIEKSEKIVDILIKLGVEFELKENVKILNGDILKIIFSKYSKIQNIADPLEYISAISGIKIMARSPTRVGARLGRPEKAGYRKMNPLVNALFPIENLGSSQRNIAAAIGGKETKYSVEVNRRICRNCRTDTALIRCPECGERTDDLQKSEKMILDIREIWESAVQRVGMPEKNGKKNLTVKGVKKLMSSGKYPEPLEKGLLRSQFDLSVNKDGTCRYDMSDVPITHFYIGEIGLPPRKAVELGYTLGKNEIFPQDIIIPWDAGEYLLRVSKFVDTLLVRYYGMEPFYNCNSAEDLIGHLVIGLAPHTSGGIVGRIIGFSKINGCYAHPFFHAAKRRNCDGDEDSIMLLLDGLLNFSRKYLPSTTGGLMDAPLVLTMELRPDEVDKEALNVDALERYPLEFYEATYENKKPAEIENIMFQAKNLVEKTGILKGLECMFSTSDLNDGVMVSSYKTLGNMKIKIKKQLELETRIRAVDASDVSARILESHFLPDLFGNFRGFFSQRFRCNKCEAKYRRLPLSGKCTRCGKDSIVLTIHIGGIVKYLSMIVMMRKEYELPEELKYRIDNILRTIETSFKMTGNEIDASDDMDNNLDSYSEEEEE
ncbi:DNA polymerase II large subunit [Caldiplasma sukawensis]